MPLDLALTRDFLELLDPSTQEFHFSALDDRREGKKGPAPWHEYGTLDSLLPKLQRRNEAGAGIFITVNRTDGNGRRASNVLFPRAVWADMDEGVRNPEDWPLRPSLTVYTSIRGAVHKGQHYWLIDWNSDEANLQPDQHEGVLRRLVHDHGADANATGYARILRLPGFFHMKAEPHLVTFAAHGKASGDGSTEVTPYLPSEILAAFPPMSRYQMKTALAAPGAGGNTAVATVNAPTEVERARRWLERDAPSAAEGERNGMLVKVANRLGDFGIDEDQAIEMMAWWALNRCEPAVDIYEDGKSVASIRSAYKSRQNPIGIKAVEAELGDILIPVAECEAASGGSESAKVADASDEPFEWPMLTKSGAPDPRSRKNLKAMLSRLGFSPRTDRFNKKRFMFTESPVGKMAVEIDNDYLDDLLSSAHDIGFKVSADNLDKYLNAIANRNAFHPVQDYFATLKWDGTPRLDTWLVDYAGVADTPLHRAFGRCTLLGAVARIYKPGHKHDTLLVLEGPQGAGKSRLIAALGGPWFSDSLALGLSDKELLEVTPGVWIAEVAELAGLSSREIEQVKKQISKQSDTARGAYKKLTDSVKRQWIMIGSTNDAEYLRDTSGGRRFWPVRVAAEKEVDVDGFQRARDQILAEAVARYRRGESNVLPPGLWADAALVQESRRVVSSLEDTLHDLLEGATGLVALEDIWQHLLKRGHQRNHSSERVLNDTLKRAGWEKTRRRRGLSRVRCAVPGLGTGMDKWMTIRGGSLFFEIEESGEPGFPEN
jgi:hypothetical protein